MNGIRRPAWAGEPGSSNRYVFDWVLVPFVSVAIVLVAIGQAPFIILLPGVCQCYCIVVRFVHPGPAAPARVQTPWANGPSTWNLPPAPGTWTAAKAREAIDAWHALQRKPADHAKAERAATELYRPSHAQTERPASAAAALSRHRCGSPGGAVTTRRERHRTK